MPVVLYADFECPMCALAYARLTDARVNLGLRHFPVSSKHPLATPAAHAVEAAFEMGVFWEMADSLFADPGRIELPHIWQRAESLGLDIDRFEEIRTSEAVRERVADSFRQAIRAGVVATPTLLHGGTLHPDVPSPEECARLACVPA